MKPKLAEMLVKSIQINSLLQKRALDAYNNYHEAHKTANDQISGLVEHMVDKGCVGEHQKQAAAEMLQSHSGAMEILRNSVDKLSDAHVKLEKSGHDLGQAVDDGGAVARNRSSFASTDDFYVGRRSSEKKASDDAILAVLNNPV